MLHHRSWFPFILIGLSLALGVIIAAVYAPLAPINGGTIGENETPSIDGGGTGVVTAEEYEAGVRAVLSTYAAGADAGAAYDALVAMRVPTVEYQAAHLELVIAFAQLKSGNTDEGQARLDLAMTAYPWLIP